MIILYKVNGELILLHESSVKAAHLGQVLYVSGNNDEAEAVFEKALKDFPENEKLKEIKMRFIQ